MGRLGEADRTDHRHQQPAPVRADGVRRGRGPLLLHRTRASTSAGTARALVKTVVFGKKQGGSTITQQYVERYYVGKTTTDIKGKIDEALLALKIDKQQEKDEILGNYMNTVYFGRGAYGIEAAARKYYGKSAADLTVSEAALLAGILPAPSSWDPRLNLAQATFRWNYVLDGMVPRARTSPRPSATLMIFPTTIEYANNDIFGGTQGYLLRAALDEVTATTGNTQEEIETQGLSIVTTIQPAAQTVDRGRRRARCPRTPHPTCASPRSRWTRRRARSPACTAAPTT